MNGLPEWTDPAGYPAPPEPGQMVVWAWEFLRRWPEYREFWAQKIEPFCRRDRLNNDNVGLVVGGGDICRDAAGNWWPYEVELGTRFGVYLPSPPDSPMPAHFISSVTSWGSNDGGEYQRISLKEHQIAIIIDLTRPLTPQFERARKAAEGEKKLRHLDNKKVRSRSDHYVRYLRILDAYEAGAQPGKIANLLFPDLPWPPENDRLKALSENRTVAQNLRDGGYRALLEAN